MFLTSTREAASLFATGGRYAIRCLCAYFTLLRRGRDAPASEPAHVSATPAFCAPSYSVRASLLLTLANKFDNIEYIDIIELKQER